MSAKRVIGIDFGTSNSVVRVKRYGEDGGPVGDRLFVSNVLFDGNDSVPTLVQIPEDVQITPELELQEEDCEFGRAAAEEQPGMKTWRDFKTDLESKDPETRMRARWLTRRFLEYIYRQYQAQAIHLGEGTDEELVYVSYPAKYSDENRQFMIGAAKDAGFSNVRGITEPEAAVKAFLVQGETELREKGLLCTDRAVYLLFLDMGAGTTDLAVCKYENGSAQIIATWPDERTDIYFGGKDIDQVLSGYVEAYLRSNSQVVPAGFIEHFGEKYIDSVKAWKEVTVSRTLKRKKSVPYFTAVKNPYPNLPDFSPAIDREEFEKTCGEYLRSFPELVNGCLAHTKKADPDFPGQEGVDLVLLTGGHSQWYFIPEILTGKNQAYGSVTLPKIQADPDRVRLSGKPQEMVAVGMAYDLLNQNVTGIAQKDNLPERVEAVKAPVPACDLPEKILTREEVKRQFTGKKDIIVPEGYTKIAKDAFSEVLLRELFSKTAWKIETVQLPEGLRQIEESSFLGCFKLKNINLPDGLMKIGNSAFRFCESLKSIVIPGSVKVIPGLAFQGCSALETVILKDGVEKIWYQSFHKCTSLTSVVIPGSVKFVNEAAFKHCPKLKLVVIEDGVQNIHPSAFDRGSMMTICCRSGSYAEQYAREHGIGIRLLTDVQLHNLLK